jgi:stage II sporulation protein D
MENTALFPVVNGQFRMEKEPLVRIGIVLEEDQKETLAFRVPVAGYRLEGGGECPAGVDLRAEARGDGVAIINTRNGEQLASGEVIRLLAPREKAPWGIGQGTLVRGIIAGRVFHWRKEIDQTLTDTLEFQARGGRLIMVNELPMETYLVGVITGEMSGECPIEYMKAQAVAARSWLLGQPRSPHPGEPFYWCNDDHCQRYQGTDGWSDLAIRAIDKCRGEVLITEKGQYCDARYSKNTGGISEDADFIWGEQIDGLVGVPDAPKGSHVERFQPLGPNNIEEYLMGDWLKSTDCWGSPNVISSQEVMKYLGRVDEAGDYFRWTWELEHDALCRTLVEKAGVSNLAEVKELVPGIRGRGGRMDSLDVVYLDRQGAQRVHVIERDYNIRASLDPRFLYSSAFIPRHRHNAAGRLVGITLHGGGWGHGAGLCQMGGLARAVKGQDHRTILLHYYSNVTLERIYT